ncbi:Protein CBG00505 [Caenorhabditis briggsae]|uniref:Protein CBG00505 n=1 Tax=Caenorhabditis briggsae TaxID=6238 RepID=B0K059_CAEBR|nr:Protein CBG00505 [Caenorhabditis briggsae]CAP22118.1 Protein CBG00505 [Caenorhabditis briggsae]
MVPPSYRTQHFILRRNPLLSNDVSQNELLCTQTPSVSRCNNSYIPTIDLLNYNSPHSTIKSLEYAITNDRDELAEDCIRFIAEKLNTNNDQLNDSEIKGLLNALCYVLRESKNKMVYLAIQCFAKSGFFETERFFELFWLEIPGIVELLFKSWEHLKFSEFQTKTALSLTLVFFERMVNSLSMGKILQEELLNFLMEKTIELSCQYPENLQGITLVLIGAHRYMTLDLYTTLFTDIKMVKGLFEYAHYLIKIDTPSYQQIMEIIVSHLNQASENTLNYLVSNCQVMEKCYEQVMIISKSPAKDSQKNLSKIVLRLITIINQNDEKALAFMAYSIFSLLLAKNLIEDREYVNTVLEEFNDSWGRSNILDCQNVTDVLDVIFTSEHATDALICFGLILMSTFVNTKGYGSKEYWNWMKTTSSGIRNNEKWTKKTRESASSVLNKMSTIEEEWIS